MDITGGPQGRSAQDVRPPEEQPGRLAAWFGVQSLWVFAAVLPFIVIFWWTEQAYWGIVTIFGTLALVWLLTKAGLDLPVREQHGAGLVPLAIWLVAAALVSDGRPDDAALVEPVPVALAVVALVCDITLRRKSARPSQ